MSSHREAPEISTDPVADNTDTYAFVSPDNPNTVTIITNYLPAEVPAGGPTFFEFGDDVLYSIYIDNDRDGLAEIELSREDQGHRRGSRVGVAHPGCNLAYIIGVTGRIREFGRQTRNRNLLA